MMELEWECNRYQMSTRNLGKVYNMAIDQYDMIVSNGLWSRPCAGAATLPGWAGTGPSTGLVPHCSTAVADVRLQSWSQCCRGSSVCTVSESVTMYYLLGLPENVFFYFIVFHFILLSLNLGFIFVIFVYLSFNFIRRGGFKGDGRNLSD